jgi:hypothetical protein
MKTIPLSSCCSLRDHTAVACSMDDGRTFDEGPRVEQEGKGQTRPTYVQRGQWRLLGLARPTRVRGTLIYAAAASNHLYVRAATVPHFLPHLWRMFPSWGSSRDRVHGLRPTQRRQEREPDWHLRLGSRKRQATTVGLTPTAATTFVFGKSSGLAVIDKHAEVAIRTVHTLGWGTLIGTDTDWLILISAVLHWPYAKGDAPQTQEWLRSGTANPSQPAP